MTKTTQTAQATQKAQISAATKYAKRQLGARFMRFMCFVWLSALLFASMASASDFVYGRAIIASDKVFFLADRGARSGNTPPPNYIMPNQVFVFSHFDRSGRNDKSSLCGDSSRKIADDSGIVRCITPKSTNIVINPALHANIMRLKISAQESSLDESLPDELSPAESSAHQYKEISKRYGFGRNERNDIVQWGWTTSDIPDDVLGFQEVVLAYDDSALKLYKEPLLESEIILQGVHASSSAILPQTAESTRARDDIASGKKIMPDAATANMALLPIPEVLFESYLGDRIFLVGYVEGEDSALISKLKQMRIESKAESKQAKSKSKSQAKSKTQAESKNKAGGFYQAIVVRDESVYFWGYFAENELQAAINKQNNSKNLPKVEGATLALSDTPANLAKANLTLFDNQYSGIKQRAYISHALENLSSTNVLFDLDDEKIYLADFSILPLLPISQEIDYYLSAEDRARLAAAARARGMLKIPATLNITLDYSLGEHVALEPEVKLVSLSSKGSKSTNAAAQIMGLAPNDAAPNNVGTIPQSADTQTQNDKAKLYKRSCMSENLVRKGFLEIYSIDKEGIDKNDIAKDSAASIDSTQGDSDKAKNMLYTLYISKIDAANSILLTKPAESAAQNILKNKEFASKDFIQICYGFASDKDGIKCMPFGFVRADDIISCRDYDSKNAPDYALAKAVLKAISELESKPIDSTSFALYKRGAKNSEQIQAQTQTLIGQITKVKSLKEGIELAKSYKMDDISLLEQIPKDSTMPNASKAKARQTPQAPYGSDRRVRYNRGRDYVEPEVEAHFIFLNEPKALEKLASKSQLKSKPLGDTTLLYTKRPFGGEKDIRALLKKPKQLDFTQEILAIYHRNIYIFSEDSVIYLDGRKLLDR